MPEPTANYRREFLKSPHHVAFGILTLGLGFASGAVLPLIAGATVYALGWVHLPDMGFFRKWVDKRHTAEQEAAALAQVNDFIRRRDALLSTLSASRRHRYEGLADVCRDIESASADNPVASPNPATDPRLRKLDELMWTYLRLLGIEESLERFLETERRENLPAMITEGEGEVARISEEIEGIKAKGPGSALESKQRYFGSRVERLEVLKKRRQRIAESQENLVFVVSEQERLDQQIKLIRADAIAMKNAENLTARIDATVEHLDRTNKWLAEMDQFKDLAGDMPTTDLRIGYAAAPVAPPPIIELEKHRPGTQQRTQGKGR